ncbi:EGF-like and EMI domain-containing protein 1 [Suncus etruscus]|uniref:EGF-like and EMI domain-containing protein 1 n=1 Tax=Suncus etruscus TaxID=109475 RepID=UPI00210F7236|nr:EGF-like and EMI domain-containing protein 1 [Suncus etruscus]
MAPRRLMLRGFQARRVPVAPGEAGARISAAKAALRTGGAVLAPPAEPSSLAPGCKVRSPTSGPEAQLQHPARTCGAAVARGAPSGEKAAVAPHPPTSAGMTWPLWLWCFCTWGTAGWPPGSALQLRPGMPNVCEQQQLNVVRHPYPCVQAFTDTVKFWKPGCLDPRWCVSYKRRTRYYTVYRQAYSMEQQILYKCCPGWRQWAEEPGCLHSVAAVRTCFNGRCREGEAQSCQCSEGFQGPHCQYALLALS